VIVAFLIASLVLAVTPGPAVLYLLARTLAHGRRAGFASLAGVALGNFGNALAASIGLAALFAVSATAFTVVKLAGAAYLIYLGVRALFPSPAGVPGIEVRVPSPWAVFRDGFVVALLNPKTALFFAAFLPQFIDPSGSPMLQSVVLGSLFVLVAATTDAIYVTIASRLAPGLMGRSSRYSRSGRYHAAASFIGLGIWTALGNRRAGE
jgi:threonine/homoserine/homoserine lactone efflux protein